MSMQGATAFQQKVSQMLSRHQKKPVLKPNKPLVLKDQVANRKLKKGEATCVTEMSVMMACWKRNNFADALCPNETQAFFQCVEKAQVAMRTKTEQKTISPSGRLPPKLATTLLKRHPNRDIEV